MVLRILCNGGFILSLDSQQGFLARKSYIIPLTIAGMLILVMPQREKIETMQIVKTNEIEYWSLGPFLLTDIK